MFWETWYALLANLVYYDINLFVRLPKNYLTSVKRGI